MVGYHVIFSCTVESPEKEAKIIKSMLDRKVDGLIIASTEQNSKEIKELRDMNFPFVLVSRKYPNIETNLIGMNEAEGVSSMVDRLVANGKKRIALVTITLPLDGIKERTRGYLEAMKKHSLKVDNNSIKSIDYRSAEDIMPAVIKELTNGDDKVDSIIFATHNLTITGLREINRQSIAVPEKLAIMSYGCKSDFDLYNPAISGVHLPIKEMGDAAVNLLLELISSGSTNCKTITLDTQQVIGRS